MYPREYFDTYWRGNLRDEVFVAMPFSDEFAPVWKNAIHPAIKSVGMEPKRVDSTILSGNVVTEIVNCIGHARLVLADISVMQKGPWRRQRNGNVMYELGLAQAVRPYTDLVVVRSDSQQINFDLANIQIHDYPRGDAAAAQEVFARLLRSALNERYKVINIKMEQARERLDADSLNLMFRYGQRAFQSFGNDTPASVPERLAVQRLLDLDIIRCVIPEHGRYRYDWTEFGKAVYNHPNFPKTF